MASPLDTPYTPRNFPSTSEDQTMNERNFKSVMCGTIGRKPDNTRVFQNISYDFLTRLPVNTLEPIPLVLKTPVGWSVKTKKESTFGSLDELPPIAQSSVILRNFSDNYVKHPVNSKPVVFLKGKHLVENPYTLPGNYEVEIKRQVGHHSQSPSVISYPNTLLLSMRGLIDKILDNLPFSENTYLKRFSDLLKFQGGRLTQNQWDALLDQAITKNAINETITQEAIELKNTCFKNKIGFLHLFQACLFELNHESSFSGLPTTNPSLLSDEGLSYFCFLPTHRPYRDSKVHTRVSTADIYPHFYYSLYNIFTTGILTAVAPDSPDRKNSISSLNQNYWASASFIQKKFRERAALKYCDILDLINLLNTDMPLISECVKEVRIPLNTTCRFGLAMFRHAILSMPNAESMDDELLLISAHAKVEEVRKSLIKVVERTVDGSGGKSKFTMNELRIQQLGNIIGDKFLTNSLVDSIHYVNQFNHNQYDPFNSGTGHPVPKFGEIVTETRPSVKKDEVKIKIDPDDKLSVNTMYADKNATPPEPSPEIKKAIQYLNEVTPQFSFSDSLNQEENSILAIQKSIQAEVLKSLGIPPEYFDPGFSHFNANQSKGENAMVQIQYKQPIQPNPWKIAQTFLRSGMENPISCDSTLSNIIPADRIAFISRDIPDSLIQHLTGKPASHFVATLQKAEIKPGQRGFDLHLHQKEPFESSSFFWRLESGPHQGEKSPHYFISCYRGGKQVQSLEIVANSQEAIENQKELEDLNKELQVFQKVWAGMGLPEEYFTPEAQISINNSKKKEDNMFDKNAAQNQANLSQIHELQEALKSAIQKSSLSDAEKQKKIERIDRPVEGLGNSAQSNAQSNAQANARFVINSGIIDPSKDSDGHPLTHGTPSNTPAPPTPADPLSKAAQAYQDQIAKLQQQSVLVEQIQAKYAQVEATKAQLNANKTVLDETKTNLTAKCEQAQKVLEEKLSQLQAEQLSIFEEQKKLGLNLDKEIIGQDIMDQLLNPAATINPKTGKQIQITPWWVKLPMPLAMIFMIVYLARSVYSLKTQTKKRPKSIPSTRKPAARTHQKAANQSNSPAPQVISAHVLETPQPPYQLGTGNSTITVGGKVSQSKPKRPSKPKTQSTQTDKGN